MAGHGELGTARQGKARQVKARQGKTEQGKAWLVRAGQGRTSGRCKTRYGE
jgi:hypothetical protein